MFKMMFKKLLLESLRKDFTERREERRVTGAEDDDENITRSCSALATMILLTLVPCNPDKFYSTWGPTCLSCSLRVSD